MAFLGFFAIVIIWLILAFLWMVFGIEHAQQSSNPAFQGRKQSTAKHFSTWIYSKFLSLKIYQSHNCRLKFILTVAIEQLLNILLKSGNPCNEMLADEEVRKSEQATVVAFVTVNPTAGFFASA